VDTTHTPAYFGWAMAHYARFTRPGYVRVDAAYTTPSVYVSAHKGGGDSLIVAIDLGERSRSAVCNPEPEHLIAGSLPNDGVGDDGSAG